LGGKLRLELREHLISHDPTSELVEVRAVREVMAGLERADREVLELAVWEQLAPREIAVALGLSSQVVRPGFRGRGPGCALSSNSPPTVTFPV
jgi:DNA-directed RNA polymerase specialized sigma24 family protein